MKLLKVNRLGDVVVHSGIERLGNVFGEGVCRHCGTRNAGEGRIGWEGNITKNLLGSVTGSVRAGNKGYNEVSGNISINYMF